MLRPLLSWLLALCALLGAGPAFAQDVSEAALTHAIAERIPKVEEFSFIRKLAEEKGLRVWLFGGTAAGYGHYVNWDLRREAGDARYQPERFDYDYMNIYRSTQDLDLVVDGSAEDAKWLKDQIAATYPHLQGSKSAWDVRPLRVKMDDKEPLLGDKDFLQQHNDSNSTGLIEITKPAEGEPVVRDLHDWKSPKSKFLDDIREGKLHYYFSPEHGLTKRFLAGLNPPIFSALRFLTKAFQYDLAIRPEDLAAVKSVVDAFDPAKDLRTDYAKGWIEKNGRKLLQNAVNLEYAEKTLDQLGLRTKLGAIKKNPTVKDSLAWWMQKEALKTFPLGSGDGRTAAEVFSKKGWPDEKGRLVVAHETTDFLAYESITRSHTGAPNVLISRQNAPHEAALHGDGFYTRVGRTGARGTGITIRFTVDPQAREGKDFVLAGDYVLIKNRAALRVIPESLNMHPDDYIHFLLHGEKLDPSDRGIFEKFRRRLNRDIKAHQIRISDDSRQALLVAAGDDAKLKKLLQANHDFFFAILPQMPPSFRTPFYRAAMAIGPSLTQRDQADLMIELAKHDVPAAVVDQSADFFFPVRRFEADTRKRVLQGFATNRSGGAVAQSAVARILHYTDGQYLETGYGPVLRTLLRMHGKDPAWDEIFRASLEKGSGRFNQKVLQELFVDPEFARFAPNLAKAMTTWSTWDFEDFYGKDLRKILYQPHAAGPEWDEVLRTAIQRKSVLFNEGVLRDFFRGPTLSRPEVISEILRQTDANLVESKLGAAFRAIYAQAATHGREWDEPLLEAVKKGNTHFRSGIFRILADPSSQNRATVALRLAEALDANNLDATYGEAFRALYSQPHAARPEWDAPLLAMVKKHQPAFNEKVLTEILSKPSSAHRSAIAAEVVRGAAQMNFDANFGEALRTLYRQPHTHSAEWNETLKLAVAKNAPHFNAALLKETLAAPVGVGRAGLVEEIIRLSPAERLGTNYGTELRNLFSLPHTQGEEWQTMKAALARDLEPAQKTALEKVLGAPLPPPLPGPKRAVATPAPEPDRMPPAAPPAQRTPECRGFFARIGRTLGLR